MNIRTLSNIVAPAIIAAVCIAAPVAEAAGPIRTYTIPQTIRLTDFQPIRFAGGGAGGFPPPPPQVNVRPIPVTLCRVETTWHYDINGNRYPEQTRVCRD